MKNHYNKYKSIAVKNTNTEDSASVLILAFDESIKLLHLSIRYLENNEVEKKYKVLDKVAKVFMLLILGVTDTLKQSQVKEGIISDKLLSLLRAIHDEVNNAHMNSFKNAKKSIEDIKYIIEQIIVVRDTIMEVKNRSIN